MTSNNAVRKYDDTIDVIALVCLLWRHNLLLGIVAGVFGAGAVVMALAATPIYRAEAVVTPVTDSGLGGAASSLAGRIGGLASLAGIDLGGGGPASQEALAVLESRFLIEEFLRRNDLADVVLPPGGATSGLWFAVQKFRDTVVKIRTDEVASTTTTIAVEWKDPAVAAQWANGLVVLANEMMRTRALVNSKRNIEYLQKQIAATNVVEMQRVMYDLIENETKTLMLANARVDYALRIIDPAVTPEARVRPKRKLIVLTGFALGLIIGSLFVFARATVKKYQAREAAEGTDRTL
ncbi:MAG: Wzz/FepE/Etk N-terminal domain-containing protein [Pseudomonadota bacterium]|nr:Wzz/FepE/Etk N-terminal domain-containing protein [Pseudomonadota bacterium]